MRSEHDVIIAGGGFSGLFCARELSNRGLSVKIIEDHNEIGYPNKCSGVVSLNSLNELGVFPNERLVQNSFSKIMFFSPDNRRIMLNLGSKKILVLDRFALDNYLAEEAVKKGAELSIGTKIRDISQDKFSVMAMLPEDNIIHSKYLIDARGVSSSPNKFTLYSGAQVHGLYKNFESDVINVFFDTRLASGFFAWIIPINEYVAKIGLASKVNPMGYLRLFLDKMEVKNTSKLVIAPIIVSGAIKHFVDNRILYVGDSAGQTKPTTGGGIYLGGSASILASEAISKKIEGHSITLAEEYEKRWFSKFRREIELMKIFRGYYERMKNKDMEKLFASIESSYSKEVSLNLDYDLHISSLISILGLKSVSSIFFSSFGSAIKESLGRLIRQ